MRKNPHGKILRGEPKEQYLSTVLKSCPYWNIKSPVNVCPKSSIFGNIFSRIEKVLTVFSIFEKMFLKIDSLRHILAKSKY